MSRVVSCSRGLRSGAHDQNRTDDLVLTKDALCRLSYVGVVSSGRVLRRTPQTPPSLSGSLPPHGGESRFAPSPLPPALRPALFSASPRPNWSGRRDSNPRRPAWKAGALPAELRPPRSRSPAHRLRGSRPNVLVGREGFEPSKAVGRQIYSLMRLTASLPPRPMSPSSRPEPPRFPLRGLPACGWSWRRESNPRPADYKSAALPLSYASDKR